MGSEQSQSYPPEGYKNVQGEPVSNGEQNRGHFKSRKQQSDQMQPGIKKPTCYAQEDGRDWGEQSQWGMNTPSVQKWEDGRTLPEPVQQGVARPTPQRQNLNQFQPQDAGKECYQQRQRKSEQLQPRQNGPQNAERKRPGQSNQNQQRNSGSGQQQKQEEREAQDRVSQPQHKRNGPNVGRDKFGQFHCRDDNKKPQGQQQAHRFQDQGRGDVLGPQQRKEQGKWGGGQDQADQLQQQRWAPGAHRAGRGQRDRFEQPRRDGPRPQHRRGGPNQQDRRRGEGPAPGQIKTEGVGGSFQQHSQKRPSQFQQRDDRRGSPQQNKGPYFQQQVGAGSNLLQQYTVHDGGCVHRVGDFVHRVGNSVHRVEYCVHRVVS